MLKPKVSTNVYLFYIHFFALNYPTELKYPGQNTSYSDYYPITSFLFYFKPQIPGSFRCPVLADKQYCRLKIIFILYNEMIIISIDNLFLLPVHIVGLFGPGHL
jgi:hypothetical protein